MKPHVKKFIIIVIVIMIVIVMGSRALLYMRNIDGSEVEVSGVQNNETPIIPEVRVTSVEKGEITRQTWLTGEILADRTVDIAPKIGGRLKSMRDAENNILQEGDYVEKGDIIAVLDHEELKANVESARSSYKSAQASYRMVQVMYADAQREKERWKRLREEGIGTEQEFDKIKTSYDRAEAELEVAEKEVERTQAHLHQAEVNLQEAWLTAPFSGIISRKYVDEGSFISPGTPLLKLIDIDEVEITGGIAGRFYSYLTPGKSRAFLTVDAYPDDLYTGKVTRVRPEFDQRTRTAVVTVRVPNEEHTLKPGMYARMQVVLEENPHALIIPDSALVDVNEDTFVYVVKDDVVHAQKITLGLREGARYEVVEGLKEGDIVVISGHYILEDEMQVIPYKETNEE